MSLTASLVAACSENDTSIFVRRAAKHWVFRIEKVSGWVSRLLPTDRYEVRKQPLEVPVCQCGQLIQGLGFRAGFIRAAVPMG